MLAKLFNICAIAGWCFIAWDSVTILWPANQFLALATGIAMARLIAPWVSELLPAREDKNG